MVLQSLVQLTIKDTKVREGMTRIIDIQPRPDDGAEYRMVLLHEGLEAVKVALPDHEDEVKGPMILAYS